MIDQRAVAWHWGRDAEGGEFHGVAADRIDGGIALRPIDSLWAETLGRQMIADGQRQPIAIERADSRGRYRLILGAHRLEAAKQNPDLSPIDALVLDARTAARYIESLIEEYFEAGAPTVDFPALAADLHALLGVTGEAAPPKHAERLEGIGFLLGIAGADVDRLLSVYRLLPARIMAMLSGGEVAISEGELVQLTALDPAEQEKVAYLLLGGADNLDAALGRLQETVKEPTDPRTESFLALFERMNPVEREVALLRLSALAPPSIEIRRS